jgi:hypothetical protein
MIDHKDYQRSVIEMREKMDRGEKIHVGKLKNQKKA